MPRKFDFLSPGIEITEVDQSILPSQVDDDGPTIIGRFRRGPGMKPVKIRSLENFVQIYGTPVPGGTSIEGDVWRDGPNLSAPTYAAYAAQAWLASRTSPINVVRLLGDEHPNATTAGAAGWQLTAATGSNGGGPAAKSGADLNSTTYGLFICKSGSVDATGNDGALAAVFYVDSGYMVLDGTSITGSDTAKSATMMKSNAANIGFKAKIYDSSNNLKETVSFNFDRNSSEYIRNKFNTNPQKINSSITKTDDLKTYWLGETYERHLKSIVSNTTAGQQYGVLLQLHRNDQLASSTYNWSHHRTGSAEAKTGYVIGYDHGTNTGYTPHSVSKLFRFESLHAGEDLQKDTVIAIEDIKLAPNPTINPYGTFTVRVMTVGGSTLESYSGCNLDRNSPNFIARRIGDMYMSWSEEDRRYRSYGDHPNVSDYIRVKMYAETQNYKKTDLPFGFYGSVRPKSFALASGSTGPLAAGETIAGSAFAKAFVAGSGSIPFSNSSKNVTAMVDMGSCVNNSSNILSSSTFVFPEIPLRVNGTDGFTSNPYKSYFGIRPKVSTTSNKHDEDYCDYVRALPAFCTPSQHEIQTSDLDFLEYSYIFSLDDIIVDTNQNYVRYVSGSRAAGNSYTSKTSGSVKALLDLNVKQFVMPLVGGFDGLNITDAEPFNETDIGTSLDETSNYLQYSLNKALDSVSDPETVPSNLLCIPGIKNTIITDKVISVAESRKDMLAVIDLENDYASAYESKDDQSARLGSVNDAINSLQQRAINTSYAAAYYPAVQIQDNLNNGERVWVPSSVAGIGAMAQSEASSELWFAPAGFNRGGLGSLGGRSGPRVIQARQRLDASERDKLYEVNINPIATFPNEGVVIFGQKTLQQTPSALDRINVRRLMIYLKSEIGKVARNLLFDQNVDSTWARFRSQAEPILSDVKSRFGLTDYRLILDGTTTTPDLIDRNIMYAKIFLKPARAIEFIAIDFVITRTGAEFA